MDGPPSPCVSLCLGGLRHVTTREVKGEGVKNVPRDLKKEPSFSLGAWRITISSIFRFNDDLQGTRSHCKQSRGW